MHNFRELSVWKKSRKLVKEIYTLTALFPEEEKFGLSSQRRRAVVSISSNIAEGAGRGSNKEFINYINICLGSSFELETQIYLAFDLDYMDKNKLGKLCIQLTDIEKMLIGIQKKLKLTC